jgi:hypothetical protein
MATGQIILPEITPYTPPVQRITGSPIDAATTKTLSSQANAAAAAKSLGAGQRGGKSRRKNRKRNKITRRRYRGGYTNMNARIPSVPEAGTIPGVSMSNNHLKNVDNLNQIRADKTGDSLIHASPMQLGGSKKKRSYRRIR